MTERALVAAVVLALTLAGCRGHRTPAAPRPATEPDSPMLAAFRTGGTPALQPYLDAYPLGDHGTRVDLLASTSERSMHLVQAKSPLPLHVHPARTETVYVLTGSGTCYVADRSYPLGPGSTLKIAPGVPHSAIPADGSTIVAISYLDPPLTEGDDRVLVDAIQSP
jgi:mannose-6-phosphate isomerase-like protein (cupin superfamily)